MEEQSFKQFTNRILKRGSHKYKIAHCYGVRDAWLWVRTNKWQLLKGSNPSHSTYGAVVNEVNKRIIEKLFEGNDIDLPHQMGSLQIVAYKTKAVFKDGKLKDNYSVNWTKTLRYWFEDKGALQERMKIKKESDYGYILQYCKNKAKYKNQSYYKFRCNRSLKLRIIKQDNINALIR